jgi:hypothetical protein
MIRPERITPAARQGNEDPHTMLSVELLDLESVLTRLNCIKVELIPPSERCKTGAWNVGQRMEV